MRVEDVCTCKQCMYIREMGMGRIPDTAGSPVVLCLFPGSMQLAAASADGRAVFGLDCSAPEQRETPKRYTALVFAAQSSPTL